MATRMQQRRGTASQWTAANTILAAGEIGFETDTNQFKIGDGVTAWTDLNYFQNISTLGGSLDDYVPLTQKGANNGVATLDSTGKIPVSQLGNIIDGAPGILDTLNEIADAINNDASFYTTIQTYATTAVSNHNSATTSVHGITNTANLVYTSDSRLTDTRTPGDGTVTENKIATDAVTTTKIKDGAITSAKILDGTIVAGDIADGAITSAKILDGTIVNADISSSAAIAQSKISGLTTDLAAKAPLADPTFTGTVNAADLTLSGNLTVQGTTTTVSSSSLEITDPLIYIGTGNSANLNDLGFVGHFNNGTYQHTGLVRDASDNKWKLFSNVTTEPTNTIDFSTWTKDTLVLGTTETTNLTATGNVDFTGATVTGLTSLPSQTGNSGKYLTTNGSVASWATLNASPALDDLSDVTITSATTNDVVYFNGSAWVNKYVQAIPTTTNAQTGTTYTLVLSDAGKIVEISNSSAITLTIPTNASVAFPVGTQITILQTGAGQITVADPSGGTLNATPGKKLRAQWSSATLLKRATDTWVLIGDLTA